MPVTNPRVLSHPDTALSREQMLLIREQVKDKLVHEYHSHRLTARLYRNVRNYDMEKTEQAHMKELEVMIASLEEEDEPHHGLSNIRLTEEDGS